LLISAAVLGVAGIYNVQAATKYWDHGGANTLWSTVANWDTAAGGGGGNPAAVPGATDTAYFNVSTNNTAQTSTLGANLSVQGLIFNSTGTTAVNSNGSANRRITLGTAGLTINSGTGSVTFGGTANKTRITFVLGGAHTWQNNSGNTLTLNANNTINNGGFLLTIDGSGNITTGTGIISGTGGLTKNGSGTFTPAAANTFTGVVTINNGIISAATINNGGTAGNIGQGAVGVGNIVLGGGTLRYTGATASTTRGFTLTGGTTSTIEITTGANTLTISGGTATTTGALTKTGAGTLAFSAATSYTGLTTVQAGTLAYGISDALSSGPVTVNGSTAVLSLGAYTDTIGTLTVDGSGQITGSGTLTVNSTDTFEMKSGSVSAILAGTADLNKTTSETVTLTGANTYSGNTTISAGTLTLGAGGSIAGTPQISIAAGATCDVSNAGITLTGAGPQQTLACSSTSGTATINAPSQTVTLNTDALISFQAVGGASTTVGKISVSGASGNLTLNNNTVTVNVTGSALAAGSYRLLDCTGTMTGSANATPTITGTALSGGYTATNGTITGAGGYVNMIVKATPSFSALTAAPSITYGATSITLTGTVSSTSGPTTVYPANGDTVSATINGHTVNGTVTNTTGGFSITYNDASLATDAVSGSPYTITYAYAGNNSQFLNAAANDTSTSLTVNQRPVALSGSRNYDNTTDAAAAILSIDNNLDGANLTISGTGTLASKDVGSRAISAGSLSLGGSAAPNYTLTGLTGSVTISQRQVTIGGTFTANNKQYDATSNATINVNSLTLVNTNAGDTVTLTPVLSFEDKTVANGKTVVLTAASSLGGADAANYTLSLSGAPTATADITAQLPVVTNDGGATDIGIGSATLTGNLSFTGGVLTTVCTYWGESNGDTNKLNWQHVYTNGVLDTGVFSNVVSNLYYGLTYYYRTYGSNAAGGAWAPSTTNFTTLSPEGLSITNTPATSLTSTSAVPNATLSCSGAVYDVYAHWNTANGETNAALWTNAMYIGSYTNEASTNISCTVTGLSPNTMYFFAFRATNAVEQIWATNALSFEFNTQTLTASKVGNGSISPTGPVTVDYNGTTNFTITADANYHITNIKTGGVDIAGSPYSDNSLTSTNYTWANITADSTIEATFAINTFTLSASTLYGSATPSGITTNDYNSLINASVAGSPLDNGSTQYVCSGFTGTGSVSSGSGTNTSFSITESSSLTWNWITNYRLTPSAGANGSIDASDAWVLSGSNVTITATASNGYHFAQWSGNTNGCTIAGDQITVLMDQPRTVSASFAVNTYTITVSAGANGSIDPAGPVSIDHGASTNFLISAGMHYHIQSIQTNGAALSYSYDNAFSNLNYTWNNVTASGSITAQFAENTYANSAPETWIEHFYPATNDYNSAAMSDTDGDGLTAWQEYIAGTDPTNKSSSLAITKVTISNGCIVISWPSSTNWTTKPFALQHRESLASGTWENVDNNIERSNSTNNYVLGPSGVSGFYRIVCTNSP